MLRLVVHVEGSHRARRSGPDLVMRQPWVGQWLKYVSVDRAGALYEMRLDRSQAARAVARLVNRGVQAAVELKLQPDRGNQ